MFATKGAQTTVLAMMAMTMMMMMMKSAPEVVRSVLPEEGKALCWPNRTDRSCVFLGRGVTEIPPDIPISTRHLKLYQTHLRGLPRGVFSTLLQLKRLFVMENDVLGNISAFAFANLPELTEIVISENVVLESIGPYAFSNLPKLIEITITKAINLRGIHPDAFADLTNLKCLTISNTGLRVFPGFARIHSSARFLLDLHDNIHLVKVPANAFRGLCTKTISDIRLTRNGIREVARDAFNGTRMLRLFLTGNQQLAHIDAEAFLGSSGLTVLDISNTAVSSLPESILGGLTKLFARSAFHLKELPPLQLFTKLHQANLTYHSHCCIFRNVHRNTQRTYASRFMWNFTCSQIEDKNTTQFYKDHCVNSTHVTCSPTPDAFNPCEDIMAVTPLRVLIWIISILALLGNTVVLLVLLGSRTKLTVPRFLMCHLAFADLCMGVYLVVIATVDILTRGRYYNHAIDWQTGLGCNAAGFFTVFASELSVFTLTAITLERWHTITHALRLDRKLRLRHACVVMTAGWVFAFLAALLPTVGVSSYSKVSICLPMDVESLLSQVFVVSLLLLNVLAFSCVCACYSSIYLTVRNPSSAPAHAETRAETHVAKRMALLIFTDFLCMAPISFFAISASLKQPLITVFHAKILLVFFYPINSCANPFLYAFFTRTFRRDFFLLTARFGLFKTRAQIYRTEISSFQQPTWSSPRSSRGTLYSLANISR